MSRTKVRVELGGVVAAAIVPVDDDTTPILDAAEALLGDFGLTRWTMEDVAERAGIGRTSVYRLFPSRDLLVHAVLARELRRTLEHIREATTAERSVEGQLVAAMLVCLRDLRASVVDRLLRSDPATILPFLTVDAGPLLRLASNALVGEIQRLDEGIDLQHATELGETAARLGLSLILTRDTAFPLDDPVAAEAAVRRLVRPLLRSLRA